MNFALYCKFLTLYFTDPIPEYEEGEGDSDPEIRKLEGFNIFNHDFY